MQSQIRLFSGLVESTKKKVNGSNLQNKILLTSLESCPHLKVNGESLALQRKLESIRPLYTFISRNNLIFRGTRQRQQKKEASEKESFGSPKSDITSSISVSSFCHFPSSRESSQFPLFIQDFFLLSVHLYMALTTFVPSRRIISFCPLCLKITKINLIFTFTSM